MEEPYLTTFQNTHESYKVCMIYRYIVYYRVSLVSKFYILIVLFVLCFGVEFVCALNFMYVFKVLFNLSSGN